MLVCLGLVTASATVVHAQTVAPSPTKPGAKGGCVSLGQWYPEGTVLKPPPHSRIAADIVFVCRDGKWVSQPAR